MIPCSCSWCISFLPRAGCADAIPRRSQRRRLWIDIRRTRECPLRLELVPLPRAILYWPKWPPSIVSSSTELLDIVYNRPWDPVCKLRSPDNSAVDKSISCTPLSKLTAKRKKKEKFKFFLNYWFFKKIIQLTSQTQTAHLLNPKGGKYGCQRLPAGWNFWSPSKWQPRLDDSVTVLVTSFL